VREYDISKKGRDTSLIGDVFTKLSGGEDVLRSGKRLLRMVGRF